MAWTYTGDPAGNEIDQIRFLIGDTDENDQQLQDGEIQYLIDTSASPQKAAVAACKGLMAKYARMVDYVIGPESVKASQRLRAFAALAAQLEADTYVKGAPEADLSASINHPLFRIGMHDNPPWSGRPRLRG